MKKLWLGVGKDCVPVSSDTVVQVVADAGWVKKPISPKNQSRSWHKCSRFWFDTLEIWKLQLDKFLPYSAFVLQLHGCGRVACVPKALTQGLGFLESSKAGLKNRVPQHVAEDLCGIRWDWHFCWWPAKSILCEGWLNHQTPSGKTKTSNVTAQDYLQSGTWFIYTNRGVAKKKSVLDPQVLPQQPWWCHTVRTQVGPVEHSPYQARLHQKDTKLMEGVDLLRSSQLQFRGCGRSVYPSSPGYRGRRAGSASRHPRCPPWPPDVRPCLGHHTSQPLGHGSLMPQENRRNIPA